MSGHTNLWVDDTILRLRAINARALDVATDPKNAGFYSRSQDGKHHYLNIGAVPSMANDGLTLATLGRTGDIHMPSLGISKVQCAFRIEPVSKIIMLYDLSRYSNTQVHKYGDVDVGDFGNDESGSQQGLGEEGDVKEEQLFRFEHRPERKVLVYRNVNRVLGMAGVRKDMFLFEIQWPPTTPANFEQRANYYDDMNMEQLTKFGYTNDTFETTPGSSITTRIHTPAKHGSGMLIRYHTLKLLGAGSFGKVFRAVNADTGQLVAVKTIERQPGETHAQWMGRQSEAKILSKLDHRNITRLIWAQNWDKPVAEIFLGLGDGSLCDLLVSKEYKRLATPITRKVLACDMLHQILQAVDALACAGIVHRDIKMDNILFSRLADDKYLFQLGDFGLSKPSRIARSQNVGTSMYMAPEIVYGYGSNGNGNGIAHFAEQTQASKADVWSLCVTLLYTLDEEDCFDREVRHCRSHDHRFQLVYNYMRKPYFQHTKYAGLRGMAVIDPQYRASAAQILLSAFDGRGLVTPRGQVVPWTDHEAAAVPVTGADTNASSPSPQSRECGRTPEKEEGRDDRRAQAQAQAEIQAEVEARVGAMARMRARGRELAEAEAEALRSTPPDQPWDGRNGRIDGQGNKRPIDLLERLRQLRAPNGLGQNIFYNAGRRQ